MAQEEFIRVGTTLYKIVNQPRINGGFVKKRIVGTMRRYGKSMIKISTQLPKSIIGYKSSPCARLNSLS